jgi:folate-dependent phosphoribosylglycinamide formyltransferase PurN
MFTNSNKTNWVACFSRTGFELYSIIKHLKVLPNKVICNQSPDKISIDKKLKDLLEDNGVEITFVNNSPTVEEYIEFFGEANKVITLHGWMRIVPPEICNRYQIYNGHPGLITTYPELKGKDPQKKAFLLEHKVIGTVIHKVTAEVDDGEVLAQSSITNNYIDEQSVSIAIREISIQLWVNFLKQKI